MDNLKKNQFGQYKITGHDGREYIITKVLFYDEQIEDYVSQYWYHRPNTGIIRMAIGVKTNDEYVEWGGKMPDEILANYIDYEEIEKEEI